MDLLNKIHRPIYFFLNSEEAKNQFDYLKINGIIKKENLR